MAKALPRHAKETLRRRGELMDLWPFKHQTCPVDDEDAILLVDVETESVPLTDEDGNMLYYCLEGEHTFSVDTDDTWGGGYSKKR